jgi:hypothetical protein
MLARNVANEIAELLSEFPAVAVLGPRQVGKTTLAQTLSDSLVPAPVYLDLERPSDISKIADPEHYFELHKDRLIILDEIQRMPDLYQVLRGTIDRRKREGRRTGQFLILGSASLELLHQSSETLAGRIAYKQLTGITAGEIDAGQTGELEKLWVRGGFPDSYLAKSDGASVRWRGNFIKTYLEKEVPDLGQRIPATTLKNLWAMLAHSQGGQLNYAQLGSGLDISATTTRRYVELLEDLLLVRTLRPWAGNVGKRLVKSPKVYIRDSGVAHALLNLTTLDDVLGHPVAGPSWEAFVIENLLSVLPDGVSAWFYRTAAGAEIDLVVEVNYQKRLAIEIKRSTAPKTSRGFYEACSDINPVGKYVVYPGQEHYSLNNEVTAVSITEMMEILKKLV